MPSTNLDLAQRFLAEKRLALVGLARNEKDFTRHISRELVTRGYEIIPVNPAAAGTVLDGAFAVARLQDIRPPVAAALLFTSPAQTDAVLRDCVAAGVKQVWFHRGAGKGSASPSALAFCAEHGLVAVHDLCPFMVLPNAGFAHRLHGFVRTTLTARARL